MLRRTALLGGSCGLVRATPVRRVWAAEADDPTAPPTTFKNVKPGLLLRLWRQIRHRGWIMFTWDEELIATQVEGYSFSTRLEQVVFSPSSAYGMVPGSYSDPLLYNTKSTSPFRWHAAPNSSDIKGHWYVEQDEILRVKEWKPKDPNDPLEMFPRAPRFNLRWEESVDAHGNRTFRYRYTYDFNGPTLIYEPYMRHTFSENHYMGGGQRGAAEAFGFKQGELLHCDDEEEQVLRRILEEEDREWEMVKRTEIVQEPWYYPGKIIPADFKGAVERAKAKFREQIRHGKETDPSKDPEYDLVQAGEWVEPRDGPRAEWRHMWSSTRREEDPSAVGTDGDGKPIVRQKYAVTFNEGIRWEDNEGRPPVHPESHYEVTPKVPTYKKYEDTDSHHHDHGDQHHGEHKPSTTPEGDGAKK